MDEVKEILRVNELSDPRVESKSSPWSLECWITVSQLSKTRSFETKREAGAVHQYRFPGGRLAEVNCPRLMLTRRPWTDLTKKPWPVYIERDKVAWDRVLGWQG